MHTLIHHMAILQSGSSAVFAQSVSPNEADMTKDIEISLPEAVVSIPSEVLQERKENGSQ